MQIKKGFNISNDTQIKSVIQMYSVDNEMFTHKQYMQIKN